MLKTKSLKKRESDLSDPENQLKILNNSLNQPSFGQTIHSNGFAPLKAKGVKIMQINLGYMCNQTCEHCHVDAGPDRKEIMTRETMLQCLEALKKSNIETVDLTGGAPEMNPDFQWFVEQVRKLHVKVIVRSNLTILVSNKKYFSYPKFFKEHKITVVASLPCYTEGNTDKQRGEGVFSDSVKALKSLNLEGYGQENSGLELNLVYNPGGPFLPPDQQALEMDYKRILKKEFDISFNHLFAITNLPISRFLDYLMVIGKYESYMGKLRESFNPKTVENVMCRELISVSWDGYIYDCDFNQMLDLKMLDNKNRHIKDFNIEHLCHRNIALANHCFGCTAGSGSSCGGEII